NYVFFYLTAYPVSVNGKSFSGTISLEYNGKRYTRFFMCIICGRDLLELKEGKKVSRSSLLDDTIYITPQDASSGKKWMSLSRLQEIIVEKNASIEIKEKKRRSFLEIAAELNERFFGKKPVDMVETVCFIDGSQRKIKIIESDTLGNPVLREDNFIAALRKYECFFNQEKISEDYSEGLKKLETYLNNRLRQHVSHPELILPTLDRLLQIISTKFQDHANNDKLQRITAIITSFKKASEVERKDSSTLSYEVDGFSLYPKLESPEKHLENNPPKPLHQAADSSVVPMGIEEKMLASLGTYEKFFTQAKDDATYSIGLLKLQNYLTNRQGDIPNHLETILPILDRLLQIIQTKLKGRVDYDLLLTITDIIKSFKEVSNAQKTGDPIFEMESSSLCPKLEFPEKHLENNLLEPLHQEADSSVVPMDIEEKMSKIFERYKALFSNERGDNIYFRGLLNLRKYLTYHKEDINNHLETILPILDGLLQIIQTKLKGRVDYDLLLTITDIIKSFKEVSNAQKTGDPVFEMESSSLYPKLEFSENSKENVPTSSEEPFDEMQTTEGSPPFLLSSELETVSSCEALPVTVEDCVQAISEVVQKIKSEINFEPSELEDFTCPITLEIFKDPVIDRHGHTFERSAIESHLKTRNVCPLSNEPITREELTPNRILRQKIETVKSQDPVPTFSLFREENPKLAGIAIRHAQTYTLEEEYQSALESYAKAFQYTKHWSDYVELPTLFEKMQELEKAIFAYLYLSRYQLEDGKIEQAIQTLEKCREHVEDPERSKEISSLLDKLYQLRI
ncbi:MAG: hypothetical protein K940chlam8_00753, partial [Chlamydiae bacterium]|nr:hypothetical protein [Chlamydiota bacterium]